MRQWPDLFLPNGYLNMKDIIHLPYTYIFVTGARQIGKTWGSIRTLLDDETRFIYMRRTQTELDACRSPEFSPFKNLGVEVTVKNLTKQVVGFYDAENDARLIAPGFALTTFHNVRGMSGSGYDAILYDEFIPEKVARPIKGEFDAWSNLYETLNSNRELMGRPAMKFINLANSNAAANPIFMELRLVTIMERLKRDRIIFWADDKRDLLIVNVEGSPISEKKKKTALGRLTSGTDFARMAYDNEYAFDDFSNIESKSLKEYRPLVTVGEITIYKHKSRSEYYITEHRAGSPKIYGSSEREVEAFSRSAGKLRDAYLSGDIYFESYLVKTLFIKYTN